MTAVALVGGTFSASAHITKAGNRAMINTSSEPLSNWAASFSEELTMLCVLWKAFYHPWALFRFLLVFFIFAIWLLPKLWHSLRWGFQRLST